LRATQSQARLLLTDQVGEGQVEIGDDTLDLRAGFMEVFFSKMGVKNLRFKPAYNPYTEPSLEIFYPSTRTSAGRPIGSSISGRNMPELPISTHLPRPSCHEKTSH
jgi:phenylalanyl-tRNA synthetase alpha chain